MTFTSFRPNATPTYTLGAHDSIRFAERPMWLSVDHDGDGPITVTADAADTTGQPVRVDAEWLWGQGLVAPQAVHEDGSQIPVAWVEGGWAYRVDVPHFSAFELCNSFFTTDTGDDCGSYEDVSVELDVKVRIDGLVTDHDGQELWDSKNQTLHVEVDDHLTEVDVLVERAWVDDHVDRLAVWRRNVTAETVDGTAYYVSAFPADQTPTDHVLREYQAANRTMFTAGNRSFVDAPMGMYLNVSARPGNVTIQPEVREGVDASRVPLFVNRSYLASLNITDPTPNGENGEQMRMAASRDWMTFEVNASGTASESVTIVNDTRSPVNGTSGRCRRPLDVLGVWKHDDRRGYSRGRLFVHEDTFCLEWDAWPGGNISGANLSHYQIRMEIVNQSSGAPICQMAVPSRVAQYNWSGGATACQVASRPSHVNATLRVHSISEPNSSDRWYGETLVDARRSSCDGIGDGAILRMEDPALTEADPVEDFCEVDWTTDGGYAELLPGDDRFDERQEAVITNATKSLNVTDAVQPYVNLSDTEGLIADEVIATFNGSIPDNISEIVDDYGDVKLQNETMNTTLNFTVVRTYSANLTDEAIDDLDARNDTWHVYQARYVRPQRTPEDPKFGDQRAPGQVHLPSAWDYGFGDHCRWKTLPGGTTICSEIVDIAILDTGIMDAHPDLTKNLQGPNEEGYQYLYCSGDHANMVEAVPPVDVVGHGTKVAGIAGARIDNGEGIAGSANVCLTDVKVCTGVGVATVCPEYNWALGIHWAARFSEADIISMSLGCLHNPDGMSTNGWCAADADGHMHLVWSAGKYAFKEEDKLVVAAAGNVPDHLGDCSEDHVAHPARHDSFLAVAWLDSGADHRASDSACGSDLGVGAPGSTILTTTTHISEPLGYTHAFSGTSAATPWVAGIAGLLYWQEEGLSASDLRTILNDTADDLGEPSWEVGAGRINATAAVENQ